MLSKKWVIKIRRESGFLMKSKEQIENVLLSEYDARDGTMPMSEMDWANNAGWIEALEFVLDIDKDIREQKAIDEHLSKILLTNEERNDIIGRTIQKLRSEAELFIDDEDSEPCNICTCGIDCP